MREKRKVNEELGKYLKRMRSKLDYSLAEVEKMTGVSASYIQRLETGDRMAPSIPIMQSIASAYGIEMEDILNVSATERMMKDIYAVMHSTDLSIDGKPLESDRKNKLMNLINTMIGMQWDEDTKHFDALQIVRLVDDFKNMEE